MSESPSQPLIYSCDDHLDIYHLPVDLWTSRLPAKYHEIGPHVVERDGRKWWMAGDRTLGLSGSYPGVATSRVHKDDDGYRPADPKLRMEDMALDGIHASIVYGPGTIWGFPLDDPALKIEVLRAWNDWAAEEFNSYLPDRLSALAALPTTTAKDAVAELKRCVDLGHKGVLFRAYDLDNLLDLNEEWDALWSAVAEAEIPVSFHIGGGGSIQLGETPDYSSRNRWKMPATVATLPLQLDEPLSVMIFSGVLERHPKLRLVLAESGVGWLPYFVKRMDGTFEKYCVRDKAAIKMKPSELFQRQVFATFEEEPFGPQLIPLLGPENFMWACDYPHPDSTWPESRKAIAEALSTLSDEAVRMVTADNCKNLYGLA
jgi:predicted TIM-barrel fold metal-dependent hydrolase